MSERTKQLEPLETVVGALSIKLPDGSFHTFQVLYGGALYPWVNGKMQYVKQDMYKDILRDFFRSDEGKDYIIPSETEIMVVRTEILNNDRKGLYRLADENDSVQDKKDAESESLKEETFEESTALPEREETNQEINVQNTYEQKEMVEDGTITNLEEENDFWHENDSVSRRTAEEQSMPATSNDGYMPNEKDDKKPNLPELPKIEEKQETIASPRNVHNDGPVFKTDGFDLDSFEELKKEPPEDSELAETANEIEMEGGLNRLIAVNTTELIELYKQQSQEIVNLQGELKKVVQQTKKNHKSENVIAIEIAVLGIVIPTLYFIGKYYGLI